MLRVFEFWRDQVERKVNVSSLFTKVYLTKLLIAKEKRFLLRKDFLESGETKHQRLLLSLCRLTQVIKACSAWIQFSHWFSRPCLMIEGDRDRGNSKKFAGLSSSLS